MPTPKNLISVRDAAKLFAVSPGTIRRRIQAGELRAYTFGPRSTRIAAEDLEQLLKVVPVGDDQ